MHDYQPLPHPSTLPSAPLLHEIAIEQQFWDPPSDAGIDAQLARDGGLERALSSRSRVRAQRQWANKPKRADFAREHSDAERDAFNLLTAGREKLRGRYHDLVAMETNHQKGNSL
jgi:hypothetical protein